MKRVDPDARRVLVLAPRGRDSVVARDLLTEAGFSVAICSDTDCLVRCLETGASCAVIAEEALQSADLTRLSAWLQKQPAWSDFPIVLLSRQGGGLERNPAARRWAEILGNVTFIERPFHPTTLTAAVASALRSRWRQYEARARTDELRASEERLSELNATLEERVSQRTNELMLEVAARERAQEQLRQAQKMESIGQLTGGIAHDFNNVLMVVMSALVLLRRKVGDSGARQLIDGAVQATERGAALTQRLLAFARQQDLKTSAVDLGALILGMHEMLNRALGPRFEVDMAIPQGLPPAEVDANQLELAILNLAINARDAMVDGGRLVIALDEVEIRGHVSMSPGRYLSIAVTDTGTGMDKATLEKAIEPFFSTKAVGKGTGLGLSMVHGLAVQLGGGFQLASEPGQGTTATILVPRAKRTAEPVVASEFGESGTASHQVLVVDDDVLVGELTMEMLRVLGHEAIAASSATAALAILRSDAPVDLMITDYLMPGMTGLELVEAAREMRPTLPVVMATGFAEAADRLPPDVPRIAKPYDLKALQTCLAGVRMRATG